MTAADAMPSTERQEKATVVITQEIADGQEAAYQRWQDAMDDAASQFAGFLGAEVTPPLDGQQEWSVIYRFDSIGHLRRWLNSGRRQTMIDESRDLFAGPATQQVLSGGDADDELVTVVVSHPVPEDMEDEYVAWQERVTEVERTFPGFRGAEFFRPVPGVQDEWTTVYRFDSSENLERWLSSDERRQLLNDAEQFSEFKLSKIRNSFGSWFSFDLDREDREQPAQWKTALAVLVGLYPTVVLLTLATEEFWSGAELWQALLVGNIASVTLLTWAVMPLVTRALRFWLTPALDAAQPATDAMGLAVSAIALAALAFTFWLVTTVIWTLP